MLQKCNSNIFHERGVVRDMLLLNPKIGVPLLYILYLNHTAISTLNTYIECRVCLMMILRSSEVCLPLQKLNRPNAINQKQQQKTPMKSREKNGRICKTKTKNYDVVGCPLVFSSFFRKTQSAAP